MRTSSTSELPREERALFTPARRRRPYRPLRRQRSPRTPRTRRWQPPAPLRRPSRPRPRPRRHGLGLRGSLGLELGGGVVQQPGDDALLGAGVPALADAGTLADPVAEVVELGAA